MTELRIEKRFSADPETVFDFVSRKDNLLKWWGPEGMSVDDNELDFTQKGPWSSVLVNADGGRYKVTGDVFTSDRPNFIEFSWAWHDEHDQRGHESIVRFEIEANASGGSTFTLIHSGLTDEESSANHNTGWTSSFKKLEQFIQ